jgi:hypothetical protein
MKKVAYNNCFGGFGISREAGEWLIQNGIEEPYKSKIKDELENHWFGFMFDKNRTHQLLIKVVETLGEDANGMLANISIAELHDKTIYRISCFDGFETIETLDGDWRF